MATTLNTYSNKGEKTKHVLAFVICLLIPLTIGALSAFITSGEMNGWWFIDLEKPSFNPPNVVFGPVWTTLYALMGVSLYLIWKSADTPLRKKALFIFGLQLFFNFWWSILFFHSHLLFISVIDILLIWALVIYMIILFRKIKPAAGYLNIPYILWVSFASILNIGILILNINL